MSKIKVTVSPKALKSGGGFYDFSSRTNIYPKKADQIFEVEDTHFIRVKLETGELIAVSESKKEPEPKKEAVPKEPESKSTKPKK